MTDKTINRMSLWAFIFNLIPTVICGLIFLFCLGAVVWAAVTMPEEMNLVVSVSVLSFIPVLFYVIPLFWMIPMTVRSYHIWKGRKPLGLAYAICDAIFCSSVSGILYIILYGSVDD